jgi:hypothetical protein
MIKKCSSVKFGLGFDKFVTSSNVASTSRTMFFKPKMRDSKALSYLFR